MNREPNQLIHETSPYLLQHAHNPVHWHAWSDEVLEKAKSENKLILVSIGYAACHWCHVMEKESFEDEKVADFMNKHFINIKIDREEHPDLDMYFMDVVQIITGQGGWPLNVFLLPNGKPFLAGTYYPPKPVTGRMSWMQLLDGVIRTYAEKPHVLKEQAEKIEKHLSGIDERLWDENETPEMNLTKATSAFYENVQGSFDQDFGGFSDAPKFPQFTALELLLNVFHYTGNRDALNHVKFSVEKMLLGGIYDQCGGGLSRYAVDQEWMVPHFEKMLYDNALLMQLLADLYKLTEDPFYRYYLEKTACFVLAELKKDNELFIASLDADSEGEEGLFYTWKWDELQDVLGKSLSIFSKYYNLSPAGNWEGRNILHARERRERFADEQGMTLRDFDRIIEEGNLKLFDFRSKRVRPSEDTKHIVSWNALMIIGLVKASGAISKTEYLEQAEKSFKALFEKAYDPEKKLLFRLVDGKKASPDACLDDYAYLIEASMQLWNATQDFYYIDSATELFEVVQNRFFDHEEKLFWYAEAEKHQYNKKDFFDSAVPSSNAVMIDVMNLLSSFHGNQQLHYQADKMLEKMYPAIRKYTLAFSRTASVFLHHIYGMSEIVIPGKDKYLNQLSNYYIPSKLIIQHSEEAVKRSVPLLEGKTFDEHQTKFYLCRKGSCLQPDTSFEGLLKSIQSKIKIKE